MPVDLNDDRLRNVEIEKNKAINEAKDVYDKQINASDKFFQEQLRGVTGFA